MHSQESLDASQQIFRRFFLGENGVGARLGREILSGAGEENHKLFRGLVLDFLAEARGLFSVLIEGGEDHVVAARTPELSCFWQAAGAIEMSVFSQRPANPLATGAQ